MEYSIGDKINCWKIIDKYYLTKSGKSTDTPHYTILCTTCNETQRTDLTSATIRYIGNQCNSCAIKQRNAEKRKIKIGQKYGKLTVIGDGGVVEYPKNSGQKRHCSLVTCDCGSKPFIVIDNFLLNRNKLSCGCLKSKGEFFVGKILSNYKYNYKEQIKFDDCRNPKTGALLTFDFGLYDDENNLYCLIEFDGRQHKLGPDTSTWSRTIDTLEDIQYRDSIKNQYCIDHNIKLIRVSTYNLQELEKQLILQIKEVLK